MPFTTKNLGLGGVCKTLQKPKKSRCRHKWSIVAFVFCNIKKRRYSTVAIGLFRRFYKRRHV